MPLKIVITGAPASGKSEFIERLKQEKAFAGFVFLDEMARQLLEQNPDYRNDWPALHREIYRKQIARENGLSAGSFITDRGTADAFAFHPETAQDVGTTIENEYKRYDAVIHLGSAASLGEKHYQRDSVRNETIQQALAIEKAIAEVWGHHPGYRFVKASGNLQEKYREFAAALLELIRQAK